MADVRVWRLLVRFVRWLAPVEYEDLGMWPNDRDEGTDG